MSKRGSRKDRWYRGLSGLFVPPWKWIFINDKSPSNKSKQESNKQRTIEHSLRCSERSESRTKRHSPDTPSASHRARGFASQNDDGNESPNCPLGRNTHPCATVDPPTEKSGEWGSSAENLLAIQETRHSCEMESQNWGVLHEEAEQIFGAKWKHPDTNSAQPQEHGSPTQRPRNRAQTLPDLTWGLDLDLRC